jgi:hypothetical protein
MSIEPSFSDVTGMTANPQIDSKDRDSSSCPAPRDCNDLAETFRINETEPSTCL